MDRRHLLRVLGATAVTAGLSPVDLEALLAPGASSANQNPSLTYMALTARAANHAVDLIDRGEL